MARPHLQPSRSPLNHLGAIAASFLLRLSGFTGEEFCLPFKSVPPRHPGHNMDYGNHGQVPVRSRVRIKLACCIFLYTIGASLMSQVYPKVSAHAWCRW